MRTRQLHVLLLCVGLTVHVGLSLVMVFSTPLYEGPDEQGHYHYAVYLAQNGSMPLILGSATGLGRSPVEETELGHHPPLYYGLLSATLWTFDARDMMPTWVEAVSLDEVPKSGVPPPLKFRHGWDEVVPVSPEVRVFRVLRLWSVLFGVVSLLCTYRIGCVVFPQRRVIASAAVVFLVSLPRWSFTHGVLDNGNLASMWSHLALASCVTASARGVPGPRASLMIGLWTGLALVTKLNSLFLVGVVGVLFAGTWVVRRAGLRDVLVGGVCAGVPVVLLSGWFFVRNELLYGDLLGQKVHMQAFAPTALGDRSWEWLSGGFLPRVLESSVGALGWGSVVLPSVVTWLFGGLLLAAVVGWFASVTRVARFREVPFVLLVIAALAVAAILVRFNMTFAQPQGRYLYPAAGAIALLLAAGWHRVFGPWFVRVVWLGPLLGTASVFVAVLPQFRIDPEAEGVDPHFACLQARSGRALPVVGLDLVSPEDGASFGSVGESAPTFAWRGPSATDSGLYEVRIFGPDDYVVAGTWWLAKLPLREGAFTPPVAMWHSLPRSRRTFVQVNRVPNRKLGETMADVPASAAIELERR